jgi:hypothetical protein
MDAGEAAFQGGSPLTAWSYDDASSRFGVIEKKSPRRGSINLDGAALLLVHQSREHFELLRRNAFREKSDDILDARLERGEHLKRIADKVQLASETRCALKITACGSNRFAA